MLYDLMSNPNNRNKKKKKKTSKENNYHYYQLCVLYKIPWFSNCMYCTEYGEIRPHRQTHTPKTVPAAQYVQYCSYFTHCIYCAIQIVSYMPLYTMQIVSILYVLYTQCVPYTLQISHETVWSMRRVLRDAHAYLVLFLGW